MCVCVCVCVCPGTVPPFPRACIGLAEEKSPIVTAALDCEIMCATINSTCGAAYSICVEICKRLSAPPMTGLLCPPPTHIPHPKGAKARKSIPSEKASDPLRGEKEKRKKSPWGL